MSYKYLNAANGVEVIPCPHNVVMGWCMHCGDVNRGISSITAIPGTYGEGSYKAAAPGAATEKPTQNWIEACKDAGYYDFCKAKSYNAQIPGPYSEAFKAGFDAGFKAHPDKPGQQAVAWRAWAKAVPGRKWPADQWVYWDEEEPTTIQDDPEYSQFQALYASPQPPACAVDALADEIYGLSWQQDYETGASKAELIAIIQRHLSKGVAVERLKKLAQEIDNWADMHLDGIELEVAVKCHQKIQALIKEAEGGKS